MQNQLKPSKTEAYASSWSTGQADSMDYVDFL